MKLGFGNEMSKSPVYSASNHGANFDDSEKWQNDDLMFPTAVVVRSGYIIDNVAFEYEKVKLSHGGEGGSQSVLNLSDGEYIVKVEGDFKSYMNTPILNRLVCTTSTDRVHSFGSNSGGSNGFSFKADDGAAICCLHGKADRFMGGIGFFAAKLPNKIASNPLSQFKNLLGKK